MFRLRAAAPGTPIENRRPPMTQAQRDSMFMKTGLIVVVVMLVIMMFRKK